MNKIRYGTKEIIATIVGCMVFILVHWLEIYLINTKILPEDTNSWVQFRVLIVAIVSVFFGPVSGVLCGMGGDLLVKLGFDPFISYPEVLSVGLYGLFVGLYYGKYHFDRRHFTFTDFVDFNAVSVISGLICAMFFAPLADFFIDDVNIYNSIIRGGRAVVGNSILIGILCPVIIAIVVAVEAKKQKQKMYGIMEDKY